MKTCPYCESEIANNAKKCKYCGEVVVEKKEIRLCPYCEAEVSETAKKCKYCGERISNVKNKVVNEDINNGILFKKNYWRGNNIFIPLFRTISILGFIFSDDLYSDIIISLIIFVILVLFEFLWNKNCFLEGINKEIKINEIIKKYSYRTSLKVVYCVYFIACIMLSVYGVIVNGFGIDSILAGLLCFLFLFWLLCWPGEHLFNSVILGKEGIFICRTGIFNHSKIKKVLKFIPYSNIKTYTLRENFFLDGLISLALAPFVNYFVGHKRGFKLILKNGEHDWIGPINHEDSFMYNLNKLCNINVDIVNNTLPDDYKKTIKKYKQTFYYCNNEIFRKRKIQSKSSYYGNRIIILIIIEIIALGNGSFLFLGLLGLWLVFGLDKPWNTMLLINENGICLYSEGRSRTIKYYEWEDVGKVVLIESERGIIVYKKNEYVGIKFDDIDNYDKFKKKIKEIGILKIV